MWRIVNLYLVLFLIDGIISLTDDISAQIFGISSLHNLRGFVAFIPFAFSLPLYFVVGCVGGFPKRILLPMIVFQVWCGLFFALPLPIFLGTQETNLLLSIVQCCLLSVSFIYLHHATTEKTWFFTEADFIYISFRWKRLLAFVAANAIIVVPLLAIYLAACINLAASHLSRGFIHLDMDGIFIETRTYDYQGHNLYLLPTFHIAESKFYKALTEVLPETRTAVILEGVTDNHRFLQNELNYGQLAQSLGLEVQDNRIFMANYVVKQCDVDISNFSPETRKYLNMVGRAIQKWSSGNQLTAVAEGILSPKPDLKLLWDDIVEMRNHRVLDCIHSSLEEHDNVLVPWGAAHMPGLEKEILKWGLTEKSRKRLQVLSW